MNLAAEIAKAPKRQSPLDTVSLTVMPLMSASSIKSCGQEIPPRPCPCGWSGA